MPTSDAERGAPLAAPLAVRVLSHTHWDREWYHPAGRFRQRLVALVDELLDAPGDAPFLLDGQAIALEDYLAVRPERRAQIAHALASSAFEAGPWYVLADELIPSGEALVRNLLEGRRQLALLGASPPAVLYCPDSFGHPAALPAIAAGFGCETLVLWRGYGSRRWPAGDAARWVAPSGASALLFHLPPDGYEFGNTLPVADAAAAARWTAMRAVLEPRSALGLLLVHNGADHHARQRNLPAAIAALARAAATVPVRATSLGSFAAELVARAASAALPEVRGELRDSFGYTWTLQGTFASRAHQKRWNAIAERLLVTEAEPLQALALWDAAPAERARAAALGAAAWRALLQCHPHDTLCGCSTDEVARAMEARLDDATSQARGIRDDAVAALAGVDAATARDAIGTARPALVIWNGLARGRAGVAEVEILTPLAAVRVGPSSAGTPADAPIPVEKFRRRREVGGVPVQVLSRRVVHHRVESPLHYPSDALVLAERAVAFVPPVPSLATWATSAATTSPVCELDPGTLPASLRGRTVHNTLVSATVAADGSVTFGHTFADPLGATDARPFRVDDLLAFESTPDGGDLYTPSPRGEPVRARFRGVRVRHRGPLRASYDLQYALDLPRRLGDARTVRCEVVATVSIDADSWLLRVDVRGRNRARDHRLRVRFGTGLAGARTIADAAFGPIERVPLPVPDEDAAAETPPLTAPMHRHVTRVSDAGAVTVIGDGLAEYEAHDDGAVSITLLRAVGELSRPDVPERPGHAGWPVPTPAAQCLGRFRARFGVFVHGPTVTDADEVAIAADRVAAEFLTPLRGVTLRSHPGLPDWDEAPERGPMRELRTRPPTPIRSPGVQLLGEGLALSTLKLGADPTWTVVRCVNVGADSTRGSLRFGRPVREAMLARLDETPLAPLAVRDHTVTFDAGPRAVVTILVR